MGAEPCADALLERDTELDQVRQLLLSPPDQPTRLLLVEGPPGIGKTALIHRAHRLAQQHQLHVLWARGGELEVRFPHGVTHQLFDAVLDDVNWPTLHGSAGLAVDWLRVRPDNGAQPDEEFAVLYALHRLAVQLSRERPLVLVVDDAHWADAPSLRLLLFLASRLERDPIRILVAARSGEPGPEGLLDALRDHPLTDRVLLRPLSRGAVHDVLAAHLHAPVSAAFADSCHDVTGGNPFLVQELATELRARGTQPTGAQAESVRELAPESLGRRLARRLETAHVAAPRVASAIAVLGQCADLARVAHVAALPESAVDEAVDAMVAKQLVVRDPLAFVHPLIRTTVLTGLGRTAPELHRRAAEVLADTADALTAAGHLLQVPASHDRWVTETLRTAAQQSLALGLPRAAVDFLRRALLEDVDDPADRLAVLGSLGRAEALVADPHAVEHLRTALAATDDPAEHAELSIALGSLLTVLGRPLDAGEALEAARLVAARADDDLALEVDVAFVAATLLDERARPTARARLRELRPDLVGSTPAQRQLLAVLAIDLAMSGQGGADETAGVARHALDNGHLLRDVGPGNQVFYLAANALTVAEHEDALTWYSRALAAAESQGAVLGVALASCWRAFAHLKRGDVASAAHDARHALHVAPPTRTGVARLATSFLAWSLTELGDAAEAERVLAALGDDVDAPPLFEFNYVLFAEGVLHLRQGRAKRALDAVLQAGGLQEAWGVSNPAFLPWQSVAARAAHELGEVDQARHLAELAVERARTWGAPRLLADTLVTATAVGAASADAVDEAHDLVAGFGCLTEATVLLELARLSRRRGDRAAALDSAQSAVDLAERLHAESLAAAARHELVATGARPRRRAVTGVGALTAAEQRVATLASEGCTNREIAERLYVTPKTVELHLTQVFRKLGIKSRTQLQDVLRPPRG